GSVIDPASATATAWLIFVEMVIFLTLLLLGYAYLWRRGDLNWVRASAVEKAKAKTTLPMVTASPAA
ncbi:MAG TPA: NADH-quinone oxidoreductase subunit A, partial [Gemmatales bacterium]|nr:NADH-quinone oxidoreductase subunit A [Gemmatales bacterium]